MIRYMTKTEYINNYSVKKKDHDSIHFNAKTETINRADAKPRSRYAERVSRQNIQKMWQDQLPLCPRARSRSSLPFYQYVWQKPDHDLCIPQKSGQGQKSFRKLSSCSKNSGRYQYHQSRSINPKGNTVKGKSWVSQWKLPP
jgi:hypothetical protein